MHLRQVIKHKHVDWWQCHDRSCAFDALYSPCNPIGSLAFEVPYHLRRICVSRWCHWWTVSFSRSLKAVSDCNSVGGLSAGALTNRSVSGWRDTFWIQAALHISTSILFFIAYFPPRRSDYQRLSIKEYLWLLDPVGSFLFVVGATLVLLALDWAPDTYEYNNPHVAVNLALGLALLVAFCLYGMTNAFERFHRDTDFTYRVERSLRRTHFACILQERSQLCVSNLRFWS